MNLITICVSFVVSILGVSFPILLQVISKLDEKYSSIHIVQLFKNERDWKWFNRILLSCLVVIFLYVISIFPFYTIHFIPNQYITFSISGLLIINTTILIFYFIRFVRKILIYYSPFDAVKYLFEKDRNRLDDSDFSFFSAIRDILLFSIKQQNETIAHEIANYVHEAFQKFNKTHPDPETEFPYAFYEMIYRATEELAKERINKLVFLEIRTVGGIWLLGEFSNRKINEITYSWLWRNLLLAIEYDRDDMIMQYWQQAHQHISYQLSFFALTRLKEQSEKSKTEEEIKQERERFLEFHYALGGLLLYKRRFQCIKRLFRYTSSIPPKHELLPESMDEVFKIFFKFRDPYENNFHWITSRYYFPEMEGLMSDYTVKNWICKYAALLLIRQYTIVPHLVTIRPLDIPMLPKDLATKKNWIDNLDHFKLLVTEILVDHELISELGYNQLIEYWTGREDFLPPRALIEKTKNKVLEDFNLTKVIQKISEDKVKKFFATSQSMLSNIMQSYSTLNNKIKIENNFNSWYIGGVNAIIDKSGFAEQQEAEHMNFDSFLAESLCKKFAYGISETFSTTKKKRYLVEEKSIFPAIRKLKINARDYLIVSFGQNLDYYQNTLKIEGVIKNSFNKIAIINFPMYNYNIVGETFFILKRSDLPIINFQSPSEEVIKKYSLTLINKDHNIFGSVIDLNLDHVLLEELSESETNRELRTSVFLSLIINVEIKWKKNSNMIAITKFSQFRDRGVLNDLKDIRPFKETN